MAVLKCVFIWKHRINFIHRLLYFVDCMGVIDAEYFILLSKGMIVILHMVKEVF